MLDQNFYRGKRVLVTGHTGFKGTWLCKLLIDFGAEVTGYSLKAPTEPSLCKLINLDKKINSVIADIRDIKALKSTFDIIQPEVVFHLAAQPLVRESYKNPVYTYETNVMGTVNVLECVRLSSSVKSVLNVTTDKVYKNNEWCWGYREDEPLDGFDPYSNSKSCSELVTHSYINSFFHDTDIAISTARAGNVIGGGDFATDRIIPDCIRAVCDKKDIIVRNPNSTRPYQHVLEPLFVYLEIVEKQFKDRKIAGFYNVGPDESDCVTTGQLVEMFCKHWGGGARWRVESENNAPHEANFLKLDCSLLKRVFGWKPRWTIDDAVRQTCHFGKAYQTGFDLESAMSEEIQQFKNLGG